MKPLSPKALAEVLEVSERNLYAGKAADVRAAMTGLIQLHPKSAGAYRLLGLASQMLDDPELAESALRDAAAFQKREPRHHSDLGSFYAAQNKMKEAERAFRAALAINRMFEPAAAGLSRLLVRLDRGREALQITTPIAAGPNPGDAVLSAHGQALTVLGRAEEGVTFLERAAAARPDNAHAHYRLAGALSHLGRHAEAETAIKAAIEKGHDVADVRLLLAHVLQDQGRFDEAEAAYHEALERRPDHIQAHTDLAELVWMRTGDVKAALATLGKSIESLPHAWHLLFAKARVLSHIGDPPGAHEAITGALANYPNGPVLLNTAARTAWTAGKPDEALGHAEQAIALQPDDHDTRAVMVQACLASGNLERAAGLIETLAAERPDDQLPLALRAVVWRLQDDPRYADLYDYPTMVSVGELQAPNGWRNLDAYLADLRTALAGLHKLHAAPFGQPVRGGTQVALTHVADPTVQALQEALAEPIAQAVAALGKGKDALRRRNTGAWRIGGLTSERLAPGGYLENHIRPAGWLSAMCWIDLPEAGDQLKFGEPGGLQTKLPLTADHLVDAQAGRVVLFPSYMWSGTTPVGGKTPGLTVSFDLVPA